MLQTRGVQGGGIPPGPSIMRLLVVEIHLGPCSQLPLLQHFFGLKSLVFFSKNHGVPEGIFSLPGTNGSPLKIGRNPKRKGSFSNSPFSGANLLVSSRER